MRAVLLTGAGFAVVDGVVLGVSLGVGATGVAAAAVAVGLLGAVVLAWLTPDAAPGRPTTVTLGVHTAPTPAIPAEGPVTEEADVLAPPRADRPAQPLSLIHI